MSGLVDATNTIKCQRLAYHVRRACDRERPNRGKESCRMYEGPL